MQSKLWEVWKDFWAAYERIIQGMDIFDIGKVKSHCSDINIVPVEHKHGNDMADHYAGRTVIEVTLGDKARVRRLDWKT